jgi:hypothetical protein
MLDLPESLHQYLTPEECAQIDQTLLPTRDRFSIRITVYSWRYLQQVSEGLELAITDLHPQPILDWLHQDVSLNAQGHLDESFVTWFGHLLLSSLPLLRKIPQQDATDIESLTVAQIIHWFQVQVKATL